MLKKSWKVEYNGRMIRVENRAFTEKMFIDDQLVAESRWSGGFAATLKASIKHTDGTEEEVFALLSARFLNVDCLVVIGRELAVSPA